jgi:RNA ligase (TIGR02306 family)
MRKLASIQEVLDVQPIQDADKIERLKVLGWDLVARKGDFKKGDLCLYLEIDSVIPLIWINSNAKPEDRHHLRTVKMKGQISQGLALPLFETLLGLPIGTDVSEQLGVTKWEPIIDVVSNPNAKGSFPSFIPKTDEVRIQTIPSFLERWKDELFYVTEKVDGTSLTFYKYQSEFGVCSRNQELVKNEDSFQWKMARKYHLEERLQEGFAIQGECIGPKIQANKYKLNDYQMYFFSLYDIQNHCYLSLDVLHNVCKDLELPMVPLICNDYKLPKSVNEILEFAHGNSIINPQVLREGIVVRAIDGTLTDSLCEGRLSFKAVDPLFLLKNKE